MVQNIPRLKLWAIFFFLIFDLFLFQLQDEKDHLEQKIVHLEKKKQQLLDEQDELQEQISHSQEIIEKLSDAEEVLKERYKTCRFLFT